MKNSKKRLLTTLVATMWMCIMFCTFTTTAFAATQLSNLEIKFEKTTSNGNPPSVTATKSGTVIEEVVWEKDFSSYDPGDVAKATVRVGTKDGYVFKDTYSKSNIKLTNATLVSYNYDNGDIVVKVKYNVGGQLYSPQNLYWDSSNPGRARWDKVDNADSYTVVLVKGSKTKKVTDVSKNYYNFDDELLTDTYKGEDNVYFKVMAVSSESNLKNSDYSESDYFDDWNELFEEKYGHGYYYDDDWDDDWDDRDDDYDRRRPVPGWSQDGTTTDWYYYEDGRYVTNCKKNINGCNYSFDSNGRMRTGWQQENGKWYYYSPSSGVMLTGWQQIGNAWYFLKYENGEMISSDWYYYNGNWYYFDASGAMATGWRYVNGYWYYLSPSNGGAMVTGTQTIDGVTYYFAGNGSLQ